MDETLVTEWLGSQTTPPTTMQCIAYFKPWLKDQQSRNALTSIIKRVAVLEGGVPRMRG